MNIGIIIHPFLTSIIARSGRSYVATESLATLQSVSRVGEGKKEKERNEEDRKGIKIIRMWKKTRKKKRDREKLILIATSLFHKVNRAHIWKDRDCTQ